ncbi:TetR/AcrR family transcriptional regulator [Deinococcus cellulosilyticus]|uniref:TetR family transcriptional regulator n=1 Tax=Deinococcus cellulosilyticus (strain DSM 18568 / NBRC 106333 / KACC 11606 / 5516J-15) TaxID=1223518 RepID=A0A511N338_DEIC1|nr:TetR/AcrR family transcriptional regulator [Deinococcus cellulosilyticus]GEM46821.1 TetR family transcriptional regulator [Deinococcus cellulosilyticus NBRC 106333 = KACC 11606]
MADSGTPPTPGPQVRRIPTQRRSIERVERILNVARQLIAEQGSLNLRMSEVAEKAEISIGSLYQYFPDRGSIIGALAEHYNAEGRKCVERELSQVHSMADLKAAFETIVDEYHQMYLDEPVMRDLWGATQVDPQLQALDAADMQSHTEMMQKVLLRLFPDQSETELQRVSLLTMQLTATAVRLTLTLDEEEGRALLRTYKKLVLDNLMAVCTAP